jgi:hypothetical protein
VLVIHVRGGGQRRRPGIARAVDAFRLLAVELA